jgi:L-asparagine oxygenase
MSVIVGTTTSALDEVVSVALDDHERLAVQWLTARLAAGPTTMVDHPESVDRARELSCALPLALRESLRRFRRDPGPEGVLIVRGLPIAGHSLPSTPTRSGSVQRTVAEASSALVLTSLQLGEVVAFRGEKDGALVQNVVPVPGREDFQGNAGSVRLHMHVENAFHPNQPDYVVLLCLRNDHDDLAGLQTASVRRATELLSHAADELATAMTGIRRPAYAILDGTLIPIDRVRDQKPRYSGEHQRHGVTVRVIAAVAGRLVWDGVRADVRDQLVPQNRR